MLIVALWVGAFPVIPVIAGACSAPLPWSCSTLSVVVAKLDAKPHFVRVKFNLACSEFCKCMQANCQKPMKMTTSDGDDSDDEEFDEEFEEFALPGQKKPENPNHGIVTFSICDVFLL